VQVASAASYSATWKGTGLQASGSASGTADIDLTIKYGTGGVCVKGTFGGVSMNQGTGC
jgi:hypothetical protein